jgi:hypothetical protein
VLSFDQPDQLADGMLRLGICQRTSERSRRTLRQACLLEFPPDAQQQRQCLRPFRAEELGFGLLLPIRLAGRLAIGIALVVAGGRVFSGPAIRKYCCLRFGWIV